MCKTIDIEIAILEEFKFNQKIIVPNITTMSQLVKFETDMLVLSKSNYATGFEIKVSLSDLRAEFKKPQHTKFKTQEDQINKWYKRFKHFYFAVPVDLKEEALELIPSFCGLYICEKRKRGRDRLKLVRKSKTIHTYKWSEKEVNYVARLGTMRIYNLLKRIRKGI